MTATGRFGSARLGARRFFTTTAALTALTACSDGLSTFDFDLRDLGEGFDTTDATLNLPDRPNADNRGVITYPNYQVALARQGDTARSVADRLGLDAEEVARFNGLEVDAPLRTDEIVALPFRVDEDRSETAGGQALDVTSVATSALERVEGTTQAPAAVPANPGQAVSEPIRYRVGRGETAFSIARQFNVPVSTVAAWNTLDANLTVREGQFLLIPQAQAPAPTVAEAPVTEPGTGSVTPLPPSAATPLPEDVTAAPAPEAPAAPDIGAPATPPAAADTAQMVRPVTGTVIREFAPGTNEGIDIAVPAGTEVKAADAGTVAAITAATSGVEIVVIKHADELLTIYQNVTDRAVSKNDTVTRGQVIGKVADGDPSFLHFEVRRGFDPLDPADFLP